MASVRDPPANGPAWPETDAPDAAMLARPEQIDQQLAAIAAEIGAHPTRAAWMSPRITACSRPAPNATIAAGPPGTGSRNG